MVVCVLGAKCGERSEWKKLAGRLGWMGRSSTGSETSKLFTARSRVQSPLLAGRTRVPPWSGPAIGSCTKIHQTGSLPITDDERLPHCAPVTVLTPPHPSVKFRSRVSKIRCCPPPASSAVLWAEGGRTGCRVRGCPHQLWLTRRVGFARGDGGKRPASIPGPLQSHAPCSQALSSPICAPRRRMRRSPRVILGSFAPSAKIFTMSRRSRISFASLHASRSSHARMATLGSKDILLKMYATYSRSPLLVNSTCWSLVWSCMSRV